VQVTVVGYNLPWQFYCPLYLIFIQLLIVTDHVFYVALRYVGVKKPSNGRRSVYVIGREDFRFRCGFSLALAYVRMSVL